MLRRKPYTFLIFIFIAVLAVFLMIRFRWTGFSGKDWQTIIEGDGKDYYAYLDQIFIKHDLGSAPVNYAQTIDIGGKSVIKCYCGTALLLSPFFLVSLATSAIFNLPVDGYTEVYQKPVCIAAFFYLLLGLWLLYKLLRQLQIRKTNAFLALIFIFFATNLLNYVVMEPAMSHVYSFSMISGFLWASNSFIIHRKWKYILISAVLFGLIYLIRPVNLIIAGFLFFFFSDFRSALIFIRQNIRKLVSVLPVLLIVMSIQHILWFIQCGKFFIWSYPYEGFYFLHPAVFNVLFSFRKGLFIYTPLLLLPVCGFFLLIKENKYRFLVSLLFFAAIVYIISAWWCWTYFDGFGMRPFIDFFAVFAIFFAILLDRMKKWLRSLTIIICTGCLALNLLQTYQYSARIIHPEYMNYDSYKFTFLRTSLKYSDWIGGAYDPIPYNKFHKSLVAEYNFKGDTVLPYNASQDLKSIQNQLLFYFDDMIEFNRNIIFKNDTGLLHANKLYAEISLKKWDFVPDASSNACFVVSLNYGESKNAYYNSFFLNYLPNSVANKWQDINYSLILPVILKPRYSLSFYIWNKGFQYFLVKDFNVKIYRTA